MLRLYAISASAMVIAMLGGLGYMVLAGRGDDAFAACRNTSLSGGIERLGGPFTLTDQRGRTVTDADVFAQPSLVYFGYSFCPDVCPLDLDRNAIAVDILSEQSIDVQPVFISVDPARDTREMLAAFADNLHPAMLALTGTPAQVQTAATAFRAVYEQQAPAEDGHYLIDHTTLSYLVLPRHGHVETFSRTLDSDTLAERVACFTATAAGAVPDASANAQN
jgi:protein SCO1/2